MEILLGCILLSGGTFLILFGINILRLNPKTGKLKSLVNTRSNKSPMDVCVSKEVAQDITKPLLLTTTDTNTLAELEEYFGDKEKINETIQK
ncbi:MAG: hypothetical protein GY928_08530 [Colwellia sp.]|nr:hypothetical protein [Colwellia sp.]